MSALRTPVFRTLLAGLVLGLAACSAPQPKAPTTRPASVPWVPLADAPAPLATSAHRTVLDPAHGDLIGELQVTRATREDTFVDLARRFNVGYEELVRANPGVDPWLRS